MNSAKPFARELLRKSGPLKTTNTTISSSEELNATSEYSGWRRYFHGFTVVVTSVATLSVVFFGFDETDSRGRDHVFSNLIRWRKQLFQPDNNSSNSSPPPSQ
jgi:hypothetical protein